MIIAVDYDGTIYKAGKVNTQLLARLRDAQRQGNIVILWTCREGNSLAEAIDTLRKNGFVPTLVNQNAPAVVRMLGGNPRKIYADIYIDDKAQRLEFVPQ